MARLNSCPSPWSVTSSTEPPTLPPRVAGLPHLDVEVRGRFDRAVDAMRLPCPIWLRVLRFGRQWPRSGFIAPARNANRQRHRPVPVRCWQVRQDWLKRSTSWRFTPRTPISGRSRSQICSRLRRSADTAMRQRRSTLPANPSQASDGSLARTSASDCWESC